MATVDSDKVVCGGIHAMIVAVLVLFSSPMMSLHAESSSVADRIKRNKHNILRTTADMDRGFSKK
jgi:hypothetical protein